MVLVDRCLPAIRFKGESICARGVKMKDRYRKLSFITDIGGMKSTIGELRGKGFPKQPKLNKAYTPTPDDPVFNET